MNNPFTHDLFPSIPQIVAARNYLGWSQDELATKAEIGVATLRRLERANFLTGADMSYDPKISTLGQIVATLQNAGVVFGREGSVEVIQFTEKAQKTSQDSRIEK
jgi:predicted transcriptional regulator